MKIYRFDHIDEITPSVIKFVFSEIDFNSGGITFSLPIEDCRYLFKAMELELGNLDIKKFNSEHTLAESYFTHANNNPEHDEVNVAED